MANYSPFSFEDAEEICEDFEDLIDTEFKAKSGDTSIEYLVDAVVVCPFRDAERAIFLGEYYRSKHQKEALGTYYGNEFDVVLLVSEADDEQKNTVIGIRDFAEEQGIQYNFPS